VRREGLPCSGGVGENFFTGAAAVGVVVIVVVVVVVVVVAAAVIVVAVYADELLAMTATSVEAATGELWSWLKSICRASDKAVRTENSPL
jgi:hypothetical protein